MNLVLVSPWLVGGKPRLPSWCEQWRLLREGVHFYVRVVWGRKLIVSLLWPRPVGFWHRLAARRSWWVRSLLLTTCDLLNKLCRDTE